MIMNVVEPMYKQIAEDIKSKIASGVLKESDKLPTEAELEEEYSVSRITVRKAISILTEEGIVTKMQGIGTFVTASSINRVIRNKVLSFTEMCALEGKKASADILAVKRQKAGEKIARYLKLRPSDRIVELDRLRRADGSPVMIEQIYLPKKHDFVLKEDMTGSLLAVLRKNGINPAHAEKTVEICYPSEEEAAVLGVDKKQPMLLHKDLITDESGEPILFNKLIINPEKYKLTIII